MDDPMNPNRDPVRDRDPNNTRWREMQSRDYGYAGPIIGLVVVLLLGLLLFSNWGGSPTEPSTQMGQKTERPTTTTPGTPAPKPATPQ